MFHRLFFRQNKPKNTFIFKSLKILIYSYIKFDVFITKGTSRFFLVKIDKNIHFNMLTSSGGMDQSGSLLIILHTAWLGLGVSVILYINNMYRYHLRMFMWIASIFFEYFRIPVWIYL